MRRHNLPHLLIGAALLLAACTQQEPPPDVPPAPNPLRTARIDVDITVTNEEGRRMAGIVVELLDCHRIKESRPPPADAVVATAATDRGGRVTFSDLPRFHFYEGGHDWKFYGVRVRSAEWFSDEAVVEVQPEDRVEIQVRPAGILRLRCARPNGLPLPGVRALVTTPGGGGIGHGSGPEDGRYAWCPGTHYLPLVSDEAGCAEVGVPPDGLLYLSFPEGWLPTDIADGPEQFAEFARECVGFGIASGETVEARMVVSENHIEIRPDQLHGPDGKGGFHRPVEIKALLLPARTDGDFEAALWRWSGSSLYPVCSLGGSRSYSNGKRWFDGRPRHLTSPGRPTKEEPGPTCAVLRIESDDTIVHSTVLLSGPLTRTTLVWVKANAAKPVLLRGRIAGIDREGLSALAFPADSDVPEGVQWVDRFARPIGRDGSFELRGWSGPLRILVLDHDTPKRSILVEVPAGGPADLGTIGDE